jgi:undecaprenyl-diphosphatase
VTVNFAIDLVAALCWIATVVVVWIRVASEPSEALARATVAALLDRAERRFPRLAGILARVRPLQRRAVRYTPAADDLGALLGVFLIFGALFVVAKVSEEVGEGSRVVRVDELLSRAVGKGLPAWVVTAALLVSTVTSPRGVGVMMLGALVVLALHGRWRSAVGLALATIGTGASTWLAKGWVQRARPAGAEIWHPAGDAFPSGHTSGAAVLTFVLAWLLTRRRPRPERLVAFLLAAVLTLTVGASRMLLDVHWLSDIAAGAALGTAWAAGGVLLARGRGGSPGEANAP